MNTEKAYTAHGDTLEAMKAFAMLLCEIVLCTEMMADKSTRES